jgi:hypothetical protein
MIKPFFKKIFNQTLDFLNFEKPTAVKCVRKKYKYLERKTRKKFSEYLRQFDCNRSPKEEK